MQIRLVGTRTCFSLPKRAQYSKSHKQFIHKSLRINIFSFSSSERSSYLPRAFFEAFLCVFYNTYLPFLYIEKKFLKKFILVFMYRKKNSKNVFIVSYKL